MSLAGPVEMGVEALSDVVTGELVCSDSCDKEESDILFNMSLYLITERMGKEAMADQSSAWRGTCLPSESVSRTSGSSPESAMTTSKMGRSELLLGTSSIL